MDTNKNKDYEKEKDGMLKEKTNEDFNKKQPDVNDPNEITLKSKTDGIISESMIREINAKTSNLKTDSRFYDEKFDDITYENKNMNIDNIKREEKSDDVRNETNPENESANQ